MIVTVNARSFFLYFIQDGRTAVHYAARSSSEGVDKLRLLIDRGADVHGADKVSTMV